MPHYTDFNGRFAETPINSGEFWGSVDSSADLTAASATLDWTTHIASSTPAIVAQLPDQSVWQANGFPLPETFAVMVDSVFTNADQTYFQVWDVDWNSNGVGFVSPRTSPVSLQQIAGEASNPQTSPHGIEQVYFQVNSLPPLAVPALNTTGTLGLAFALIGIVLLVSLRKTWKRNGASAPT